MARIGMNLVCAALMAFVATAWLCGSAQGQTYEATALTWRAIELSRTGKAGEAILLFKRALELREKALPVGHPEIVLSLNVLASLYQDQGRLTEAEPLYKRALELREKALPVDRPEIVLSLNNLASLYQDQGRLREAEALHKRAFEMFEKALPADHAAGP